MSTDTTSAHRSPDPVSPAAIVDGSTGTWTLDPQQSRVAFGVKNLWGLATVRGTFGDLSGTVHVGPDGSVAGTLVIDTSSVDTAQRKRDDHLRSADFFDVASFPTMSVEIDRVVFSTSTSAVAHGRVTLLGESRALEFHVDIAADGESAKVAAGVTIDRGAHGMTWSPMRMAGMDVRVDVSLSYRRTGR